MDKNNILNEIMQLIPQNLIKAAEKKHQGKHRSKSFNYSNFLKTMIFSTALKIPSLRMIQQMIDKQSGEGYHLGLKHIPKSTLSDALNNRPYQYFQEIYNGLQKIYPLISHPKLGLNIDIRAIDATTFELPLLRFDWATFRKTKSGIKILTEMSINKGNVNSIEIFEAKKHECKEIAEKIKIDSNTLYLFDRGFTHYELWCDIDKANSTFITRMKKNTKYYRKNSRKITDEDRANGVRSDQEIRLYNKKGKGLKLRRIVVWDDKKKERIQIITNDFTLTASEIALLYRYRWEIELLFRTIKCELEMDHFLGSSLNAIYCQLYTGLIYHYLLLVIKSQYYCDLSIGQLIKIVSTMGLCNKKFNSVFSSKRIKRPREFTEMQLRLF